MHPTAAPRPPAELPPGSAAPSMRRRYLGLVALRWLPVGLALPVTVLVVTQRGISLGQFGLASAAQGLVVLVLQLPTGGLADAVGRRPVLVAATVLDLVALGVFLRADSVGLLLATSVTKGVSRALDSGPLDSWFVDAELAADPGGNFETTLAHGAAVLSGAIATGAMVSGGLVALGGLGPVRGLATPIAVAIAVDAVAVVALSRWMVEPRPGERGEPCPAAAVDRSATHPRRCGARAAAGEVAGRVRQAARMVAASPVLLALAGVEALWSFGMPAFEVLLAPRLSHLVGQPDQAAAILGPVTSGAWSASALAAAAVPFVVRRVGAPVGAAALRVAQGATVAAMALAAGPIGLVAAFTATYAIHGAANPVHQGLVHRQVRGDDRVTVVSVNSMAGMSAGALGGIALGWLADRAGIPLAMATGAAALAAAAPLYLVGHPRPSGARGAVPRAEA